jgi:hypothetical protein
VETSASYNQKSNTYLLFSRNRYVCPIWIFIFDTDQTQINILRRPTVNCYVLFLFLLFRSSFSCASSIFHLFSIPPFLIRHSFLPPLSSHCLFLFFYFFSTFFFLSPHLPFICLPLLLLLSSRSLPVANLPFYFSVPFASFLCLLSPFLKNKATKLR